MHRISTALLLIGSLLSWSCAAGSPPAPERSGTGWDLVDVDLALTLDPEARVIRGEGVATLRLLEDRSFGPTLRLHEGRQRFLEVTARGGARIAVRRRGSRADVRFDEPRRAQDTVVVSFRYEITESEPADYPTRLLLHRDAVFASYGYNWHPQPIAAEGGGDRLAAGTLRLVMPTGWRSDSQGVLVSRSDDGRHAMEVWTSDAPVNRRFVAGPFDVVTAEEAGSVPVRFLLRSTAPGEARAYAEQLGRMVRLLERRFGPNPMPRRAGSGAASGQGLAVVEVPDATGFGARNEDGAVLVTSPLLRVGGAEPRLNGWILAHELAHMWWGIGVQPANPGYHMIGEGLAQYAEVLWIEETEGAAAATEFMRFGRPLPHGVPAFSADGYFALWREGADAPLMADHPEDASQITLPAKRKGPWVWHMLRRRVGDELFFGVLQGLAAEHGGGRPLSLVDVRRAFVTAAPRHRLETFFAEWLDRTGAPLLEAEWVGTPAGLEVIVRQRGDLYHLPLELGVVTAGDTLVYEVTLNAAEQRFLLPGDAGADVVLDPANRLLLWKPDYGPAPE